MTRCTLLLWLILGLLGVTNTWAGADSISEPPADRPASLGDGTFFPIGVWLQNPKNATRYRAAGFNLYVGLWRGPTEEQLRQLKQAGMSVICHQNRLALAHLDDPIIAAWMHQDEPDNAQSLGDGKGYGPPLTPDAVFERYERMRAADSSRPVLLNLGQGVAWDRWHGRGVRTNHPEDYPQYVKACDIASFDIYPVTHSHAEVAGNLWYVARGVERLVQWAGEGRSVWNCIECTRINNKEQKKPTPHQVRSMVWMSLIHGSRGLIYFVHEWQPRFNEAALLSDGPMYEAVSRINHRIQAMATVLNSPSVSGGITVESAHAGVPIATMMKRDGARTYLFAAAMRGQPTRAKFTVSGVTGLRHLDVLDENRSVTIADGVFTDDFEPWGVHLYLIAGRKAP
jgi:hypothetical protein